MRDDFDDIKHGLEGFGPLWARVARPDAPADAAAPPAAAERKPGDAETLSGLISDEAQAAAFYDRLAPKCRSRSRQISEIASDERLHLKHLQTEYFLLTGDSFPPAPACPLMRGGLSDLRAAYLDERAAAEKYLNCAASASSDALAELYRGHAADEAEHARILRGLIMGAI